MPEMRLSDRLREFLKGIQGKEISLNELRNELRIDPADSAWDGIRVQMKRCEELKLVKPSGRHDGIYKVIKQIQPVKVFSVDRERKPPVDIYFPRDFTTEMEMSFAEHLVIREGDLITLGGVKSTGKTHFALSMCAENIDASPVLMGNEYTVEVDGIPEPSPRFIDRLDRMSEWVQWANGTGEDKFTLLPVQEDFAEHVIPNRINIIDWINLDANRLYDIGAVLHDIKAAVGRGVGFAILQKGEGSADPRGGQFVRDFSDLELTLNPYGKNPYDVLLTIRGAKETKKAIVGKTYAYTIGEGGTKMFNFREVKRCNGCGGTGKWKAGECDRCLGTGWQE